MVFLTHTFRPVSWQKVWQLCLFFLLLLGIGQWALANDADGGFVWQIEKTGQPTSYLVGTIHLGQANSKLPASYQRALQNSRALVVESREEDWQGSTGMALHLALGTAMYDAKTLRQNLGTGRLDNINAMLKRNGSAVQLDGQAHMAPWMAYVLVATDYTMPGYTMETGVDMLFINAAKQQQKPVQALETLEPILVFKRIPDAVVLRGLDASLANDGAEQLEQVQMLKLYHQGRSRELVDKILDVDGNLRYLPKQDHGFWRQWLFGDLLQQRNSRWLPKINRQIKQQPSTVAVGVAHLFGGSGLIALLREQGYRVTPYRP